MLRDEGFLPAQFSTQKWCDFTLDNSYSTPSNSNILNYMTYITHQQTRLQHTVIAQNRFRQVQFRHKTHPISFLPNVFFIASCLWISSNSLSNVYILYTMFIRNLNIFKIVKLRFAARRVDIVSLPSVTLSEAKSAHRGRAYRSLEDLHSDTDVIGFIKNNFWTLFV